MSQKFKLSIENTNITKKTASRFDENNKSIFKCI